MPNLTAPRRGARRATLRRALPLVAAATLACDGEISGIGGATGSTVAADGVRGSAAGALDPALFGLWRRTVYFDGTDGSANSSETTWRFSPDGLAARTVVARNFSYGYVDAVRAGATWRVEGGTVVVAFLPPDRGTVRFGYAVDRLGGDVLVLGRERYLRVGG